MDDPLSDLPGYALRRASSFVLAELKDRLIALQLRHTDVAILILIDANPGIKQAEIGKILDIQRANMTPLAAILETRALITRQPVDGRSHGLQLTPEGTIALQSARKVIETFEVQLLKRIPTEHREHLLPALKALWQNN